MVKASWQESPKLAKPVLSSRNCCEVLNEQREQARRCDYNVAIVDEGLMELSVKESCQSARGTAGWTSCDVEEMAPQA